MRGRNREILFFCRRKFTVKVNDAAAAFAAATPAATSTE